MTDLDGQRARTARLARRYGAFLAALVGFILVLALMEQAGASRAAIGYAFLGATFLAYAGIGVMSRTGDAAEYYVAGRRVPAVFNGMASAADWMSAASFIGLAGGLYLHGYAGLAYVLGWTGGFVLVGLLLAPYLRRFGRYTIPDFIGARYGGHVARLVALAITVAVSFIYVVAQLYGVGLITTRLTGADFTVGIYLGLAGVLMCSFLGGMKAVTWTQVAQYLVLTLAYVTPVAWLSLQHTGNPIAPLAYGEPLRAITQIEQRLVDDPREREVRRLLAERAAAAAERLADVPRALAEGRAALEGQLAALRAAREASIEEVRRIEEALARFPRNEQAAREAWLREAALAERATALVHHGEAFAGRDEAARDAARRNFLALVACLMLGTAGLPHLLVRYYTTPDVRQARSSVVWTLGFVSVLYLTAPALAVLVKYVVYHDLVGSAFNDLPAWVRAWSRVDASLLSLSDVNRDGVVQLAEIALGQDVVALAMPEIAGLPYVMSALVAAGALAAALSTADGLLLTIGNALSHDLYYKMVDPQAPAARRVLLSKVLLLAVAVLAAMAAARRSADILFLVAAAFSLAAASLFPALVLGIAWKRATGIGAVLGMLTGFAVTAWYMVRTQPWLREAVLGVPRTVPIEPDLWWGIQPTAAGVFGLAVGFAVTVAASLATPEPAEQTQRLVERLRFPRAGAGD